MTDSSDPLPTVLIVDDEADLADLYAEWLDDEYAVRTAYDGNEALAKYDEAVDVILLDRRMPDLSGDEVLERIREQDWDCQVVMVTAVDPDFDILDMGFDSYVTKPVDHDGIKTVIEQMLTRQSYSDQLQTYYSLVARRAALEAEKSEMELANNDKFAELTQRITELEGDIDTKFDEFEKEDFEAAFREFDRS